MFWRLFRLFYKENFSFKRFLGFDYKKERIKSVLIIAAILYALLAFIGSFGYMFFDLGKMLLAMNQLHIIISFITAYAISIAIMFVLFRADGMIFHYQDYDILAPLPINTRVVLGAKIAVLYLMTTILTILISLPMAFAYFYFSGFHILSFISYVVGLLVLPLIPIVLMSFVSLLIKTISNKFKYSKLISIFLVFAVFIGFFIWSFSMADVEQNPLTGQIDLLATLSRFYLPMDWYMRAVHQREVLPLLYLISSHLLIFGIYFLGIGPLVNHTNQNQTSMRLSKTNKTVKYQTRSIYSSLLAKEFRKFFSVTIYAVNAGLGPVILIVLSVASLFYRNEISGFMTEMVGFDLKIEILLLVFVGFSIVMTYTPAISLSLEGKNFWIIKSLPISANQLMLSKIFFNILLVLPIAVISVFMLGFALMIPIIHQFLMVVLVIVFGFMMSTIDAIFNLYMPKFNYKNDVEVVKQSASAFLGIFGGFGMLVLNGLLYIQIDNLEFPIIVLILIGINAIFLLLSSIWLAKVAHPLIHKMQA